MSLPSLASVADLEQRLGAPVDDVTQAQALLDDASGLIRLEVDPVTWVGDDGSLGAVPAVVLTVCCKAVRRALDNPEAVTQRAESIGSYSDSVSYSNASPDVYLTNAERRLVRRAAGRTTVGSVLISSDRSTIVDQYIDIDGEDVPFHVGTDGA